MLLICCGLRAFIPRPLGVKLDMHLMKKPEEKLNLLFCFLMLVIFSLPFLVKAATENLDEMMARRARRTTNVFPSNVLENASNYYIWQPETLEYKDIQTGHEVWKISNTPNLMTYYQNDIGVSPWSANGSKMAITSWNRLTAAYPAGQQSEFAYKWMTSDTNGNNLRMTVEAGSRLAGNYFHWSPQIPGIYYEIGEGHLGSSGSPNVLYKTTVASNGVISKTPLVSNLNGASGGIINKMISPDGRRVIIEQNSYYYPIGIYPESSAGLLNSGYSMDRSFGNYGDMLNGTPVTAYHDNYIGGDGTWFFALPSGTSTWWRIKTLGSATDSGALYTGDDGSHHFGEVWPEDDGSVTSGNISSPFAQDNPYTPNRTSYWSHFVPDMWGRYSLFSNVADFLPGTVSGHQTYGTSVWDIEHHIYSVPTFDNGAQHHDWHGFTDWTISNSSGGASVCGATGTYANDHILSQKYNDSSAQILVNCAHTAANGGTDYNVDTRPGQSPDGTKVAWHSEFLNSTANMTDVFWSVVYYPYPPTTLSAVYSSGVKLSWLPPQYTNRGWPYASANPAKDALGWPLLDSSGNEIGETLFAREINKYHIWRSTGQNGPWQEVSNKTADYSYTYAEDSTMFMLHPVANGIKVSPSNKISIIDNPGNGTFYYAITSEEYSGLVSDQLSEILKVVISGFNISSQQVVATKGQKNFWTTAPAAPTGFSYTVQSNHGQYRLNWTQPGDAKIRYYNIYYSNSLDPTAVQQKRIASVPAGNSTYLDWLADPPAVGHYGITSVDGYGNESAIVLSGPPPDTTPPASPTGVMVN